MLDQRIPPAIDIHHHIMPDRYAEALRNCADDFAVGNPAMTLTLAMAADAASSVRNVEDHLEDMDSHGISVAVLSLPPPGIVFGDRATRVKVRGRSKRRSFSNR